MSNITRRDLLKTIGASGCVLINNKLPASFNLVDALARNPLNVPADQGLMGILTPSSDFTLSAKETDLEILPGKITKLWVYEALDSGKKYINPVIKIKKGAESNA